MKNMWLIFSADQNWSIGNKGGLLVRIPEDLRDRFKVLTSGSVVVMGRKTLESLPGGRALPNRTNIVLSRNNLFSQDGIYCVHSLEELFDFIKDINGDVFIIGGAEIYKQLLPYCDGAFVTKINSAFTADAKCDNLDELSSWKLVKQTPFIQSEAGVEYKYCDYINSNKIIFNGR